MFHWYISYAKSFDGTYLNANSFDGKNPIFPCLNGNGHALNLKKKRSMVLHLCGHLKINHTLLLLNRFTKSAGIKVYFDVSKCDRIFDELY